MEYKITADDDWKFRFNCPYCSERGKSEDKKFHLYLNIKSSQLHCFRCGYWGNVDVNSEYFEVLNPKKQETLLRNANNITFKDVGYLTEKINKISLLLPHYKYLISRKIKPNVIYQHFFYIPDYTNYVWTLQSSGYIGRNINDDSKEPRYLIIGGRGVKFLKKDKKLFKKDMEKLNKEAIYIVEGLFSSILLYQLGISSIATLGSEVSKNQLSEILQILNNEYKNYSKIIIAPDFDARGKWLSLYLEIMNKFGISKTEYVIFYGYKDISEYIEKEVI